MDIEQNKIEDLNEQIIIDKKNDLTTGKTGEKIINFTIPTDLYFFTQNKLQAHSSLYL